MNAHRRLLLASTMVAGTAVLLGLTACATLLGPPSVTLSQRELQDLVERNFPVDRTLLEIFDVTVDAPRLNLLADRNRVASVVDLRARNRLLGGQWRARLNFDAALRFDASDHSLRLSQVRVQDLALDNPSSANRSTVERLGAALVERVLEDSVLYRMPAAQQDRLKQAGLAPGAVNVTRAGVEITFQPLAK